MELFVNFSVSSHSNTAVECCSRIGQELNTRLGMHSMHQLAYGLGFVHTTPVKEITQPSKRALPRIERAQLTGAYCQCASAVRNSYWKNDFHSFAIESTLPLDRDITTLAYFLCLSSFRENSDGGLKLITGDFFYIFECKLRKKSRTKHNTSRWPGQMQSHQHGKTSETSLHLLSKPRVFAAICNYFFFEG